MAFKTCLILLAAIFAINGQLVVNGKIKITIVTTAGCGDTVRFIRNQLNEVYNEYKDYIELEFVPWGRTRRNNDGTLTCQFGERDCWANRLQRCALDMLKNNQDAQMHYMNCEFSEPRPSLNTQYLCAQGVGLNLVELDYCVSSSAGDVLDVAAEARSAEPMRVINFVPAIVLNDQIDLDLHNQAYANLRSQICFALAADPNTSITTCGV